MLFISICVTFFGLVFLTIRQEQIIVLVRLVLTLIFVSSPFKKKNVREVERFVLFFLNGNRSFCFEKRIFPEILRKTIEKNRVVMEVGLNR